MAFFGQDRDGCVVKVFHTNSTNFVTSHTVTAWKVHPPMLWHPHKDAQFIVQQSSPSGSKQYTIVDVKQVQVVHTVVAISSTPLNGGDVAVLAAWAHDLLSIVTKSTVRILSTTSGRAMLDVQCSVPFQHCRSSMAFGRDMFVLSVQGLVHVYDTKAFGLVHVLQGTPTMCIGASSFSPCGTLLALPILQQDGQSRHGLCILDAQSMLPAPALALTGELHAVIWNPNGTSLALVSHEDASHSTFVTRIIDVSCPLAAIDTESEDGSL